MESYTNYQKDERDGKKINQDIFNKIRNCFFLLYLTNFLCAHFIALHLSTSQLLALFPSSCSSAHSLLLSQWGISPLISPKVESVLSMRVTAEQSPCPHLNPQVFQVFQLILSKGRSFLLLLPPSEGVGLTFLSKWVWSSLRLSLETPNKIVVSSFSPEAAPHLSVWS